jgi:LuxR family maltose regulon positive regulatory protein
MRHPLPPDRLVDTQRERSLSFGRPETRSSPRPVAERSPIAVGPGRAAGAAPPRSSPLRDQVNGYPIQLAKVQRPALRDETLERPRLLDWLRAKIHGRVVLVLADAGYGKTTLLADFSRRTRMRTLWYRLDDDDRDWVSFLHHLVAAGREHDPMFAPETAALLAEIGTSDPGREVVLDTFLRELPTLTVTGTVLVLDDFHLVDDAADVRHISRELLARAPERLTIVFASRRPPTVPLARLRAVGEVAELGTNELRFDASETAQLFTETYGRRLDADVLADLAVRTEGWIASLQLVQAALRDRTPSEIRRFVRSLNGADHEMYDYLAEEVVGELDDDLQRFLMETSLLQVVTPELAAVVSGRGAADVGGLTAAAERLTLLSRLSGGPRTHQRYHPLVREFLEARLQASDGADAVADLHRRVAGATAATDWRVAAHHYREAGDTGAVLKVVGDSIPTIMGNGQYALAEAFIGSIPADERPPGFDLILSRVEMQQGDYESAIAASQAVLDSGTTDPIQRDHALLNLLTLYLNYGDGARTVFFADELRHSSDRNLRMIAEAATAMVLASETASIDGVNRRLANLARGQRGRRTHHYAVTQYNLAMNSITQDRPDRALAEVDAALEVLEGGSAVIELVAARVVRAQAFALIGKPDEAERAIASIYGDEFSFHEEEVLIETGELYDSYLSPVATESYLNRVADDESQPLAVRRLDSLTRCRFHARRREFDAAAAHLTRFPAVRGTNPGTESARLASAAYLAVARGDPDAGEVARGAELHARSQQAHRWRRCAQLLIVLSDATSDVSGSVALLGRESPHTLTFLADLIARRLSDLDESALRIVREQAGRWPGRWRYVLRELLSDGDPVSRIACAQILEEIGERSDIARLRRVAKETRRRPDAVTLGRTLSRRLAHRVFVEDQGRVSLRIGSRTVAGSQVRRKVLAMLCFLLSRPDMAATRDQVLEALWPELDPDIAVNSLNQTLYFLRRVFEEDYSDDLSPGYIHHDADVLWLDPELVSSRSVDCRQLIRGLPNRPSPDEVEKLVATYRGRFALDFEYEEWASGYRDSLHAAYLEIVERSVSDDFATGHHDRGISVARRALDVDDGAEQIELCLLRLYRVTGAHAAAAEQYAHYAAILRDELGLEPPPLEAL